jgi:hypothetical protein
MSVHRIIKIKFKMVIKTKEIVNLVAFVKFLDAFDELNEKK